MTFASVVIPLYNKAQYVKRAIDSVLGQETCPVEIIVVDDGSTDGGKDIVFEHYGTRVKVITQPNAGEAAARNAGIRASKGDFIAFLDADDEWKPWFLSEIAGLIRRANRDAGLFCTAFEVHERQNSLSSSVQIQEPQTDDQFLLDYPKAIAAGIYPVSSSSVCVRKEMLDFVGLFDTDLKIGTDVDLWIRLSNETCFVYSYIKSAIYHRDALNRSVDNAGAIHHRSNFIRKQITSSRLQKSAISKKHLDVYLQRLIYNLYVDWHENRMKEDFPKVILNALPIKMRARLLARRQIKRLGL